MADLEFFFDPVCPWAWITSRWVAEVQQLRDYDVTWRFISLKMINESRTSDWYTPEYRAGHMAGLYAHRVCDEVRVQHGNESHGNLYTALGLAFHNDRRRPEIITDPVAFMAAMLTSVGLSVDLAAHALDESHDDYVREDTDLAWARAGRDLGTPVITFHPGAHDEGSFFGPVIPAIPRGEKAVQLWDAIELIATSTGMAELKRTRLSGPRFD